MTQTIKSVQLAPAAADFIASHPELRKIIGQAIRRLAQDPLSGIPLQGRLKALRKKRIGNYRIIYSFTATTLNVVDVGDRKDIYRFR